MGEVIPSRENTLYSDMKGQSWVEVGMTGKVGVVGAECEGPCIVGAKGAVHLLPYILLVSQASFI